MKLQRPANWMPILASVLMFALVCAVIAYWAIQMLAPRNPIAPSDHQADPGLGSDLSAAATLFGTQAAPGAQQQAPSDIKLLGLASADDRAAVVIAYGGAAAKAYGIGEELGPGVKVHSIQADKVVISRKGDLVELAAPPRPDLSILTNHADKAGRSSKAGTPPAPGMPAGGFGPGSSPGTPPPLAFPGTSPATATANAPAPQPPAPQPQAASAPAEAMTSPPGMPPPPAVGMPPMAPGAMPGQAASGAIAPPPTPDMGPLPQAQ